MLEILSSQKVTPPAPPNPFQALDAELADIQEGELKEIVVKETGEIPADREKLARRAGMALRAFARVRWGTAGVVGFEILEEGIKFLVRRTKARRKAAAVEGA